MQLHLPYNGGFQVAGVKLRIYFEFRSIIYKKKQLNYNVWAHKEKKEEI